VLREFCGREVNLGGGHGGGVSQEFVWLTGGLCTFHLPMTSTKTLNHPHYEGDYGESIREENNTKRMRDN
jgi:hypothetical protein